jgi:protein-disulfide isomerase
MAIQRRFSPLFWLNQGVRVAAMTFLDRRSFGLGVGLFALGAPMAARAALPDMVTIGRAEAPLHLEEYASATCPHCAHFHETNWARLNSGYIDTGRLRLTMREMLTPPHAVALAMFQLARCETTDGAEYFRRLGILFERQRAILETGTVAGVRDALLAAGAEWGLPQTQVLASLNDPAGRERITRSIEAANAAGVTSTPTFFLNGQRLPLDFQTADGMTRTLDAALR